MSTSKSMLCTNPAIELNTRAILNQFDASAKEKYERSSRADWCLNGNDQKGKILGKKSARRSKHRAAKALYLKSTFAKKVASKLSCMVGKLSRRKITLVRDAISSCSAIWNCEEQIAKGSNTPSSSRPSSISTSLAHIVGDRAKHCGQSCVSEMRTENSTTLPMSASEN